MVTPIFHVIIFNTENPKMANPKLRQALSLATDRGELAKGGYLGQFPKATWGVGAAYAFKKTAAGTFPAVDVAKAKELSNQIKREAAQRR